MKDLVPYIEIITKLASSNPKDERSFVESLLDVLIDAGFKSAYCCEISRDPANDYREMLVLRAYRNRDPKVKLAVGIRLVHETSRRERDTDFTVCDASSASVADQSWVRQLGLIDDRWVEITIRNVDQEPLADLILSIPAQVHSAGPHQNLFFSAVKTVVEQFETSHRHSQNQKARDSIQQFVQGRRIGEVTKKQLADLAVQCLMPLVDGEVTAVFHYQWAERRLVKIAEQFAGKGPTSTENFEEFYIGEYLTGHAWEDPKLRRIPDYERYIKRNPSHCLKESYEYHQNNLVPVHSVLYESFGNGFLQFFIRIINRRDLRELPFNDVHAEALRNACERLNDFIDDVANHIVITQFERLSSASVRVMTQREGVVRECVSALDAIGFDRVLLLNRLKGAQFFDTLSCLDTQLKPFLKRELFEVGTSPLLDRISQASGMRVWRISDNRSADDSFAEMLSEAGVSVIVSAASVVDSRATLALRCVYQKIAHFHPGRPLFNPTYEQVLPALLSITDGALDASRSMVSATFAEELVAHFGHEVATPISSLSQKAIKSINFVIKQTRGQQEFAELVGTLTQEKNEIDRRTGQITQQLRHAIALADKSNGVIDVKFEPFPWSRVVKEAWEEASEWHAGDAERSALRGLRLRTNDSIAGLRSIGDENLLRGLLVNLLKNAIKYSLPRRHGEPMEIRVLGQPQQGMDIVQVENWGIGIPEDKREEIFEKFVRIDRTDSRRAIRGMGLGLYVSRLYATVHDGQLFCRTSKPTLDDPVRTKKLEGFQTIFELRLPTTLQRGIYKRKLVE